SKTSSNASYTSVAELFAFIAPTRSGFPLISVICLFLRLPKVRNGAFDTLVSKKYPCITPLSVHASLNLDAGPQRYSSIPSIDPAQISGRHVPLPKQKASTGTRYRC